ncbi:MAG: peptide-methionine (R)-S-oxide reductase MsrB [Gammaproteobacteria bacterium]|nr:peptide-methionine (R)-S-oxide reductase MsrB [Gammaproteobacteria bacterium]
MRRRSFLAGVPAGFLSPLALVRAAAGAGPDMFAIERLQANWQSLLAPGADVATTTDQVRKTERAWRDQLGRRAYAVLFEEDTERPYSSALNDEKRQGVFVCAACSLPLFTSAMKFDSGTGWPSFFTTIPDHVATRTDYKLVWPRTEYHCVKCSGHQGHVFDDGPQPTGQRWCNNGLALRFIPTATA